MSSISCATKIKTRTEHLITPSRYLQCLPLVIPEHTKDAYIRAKSKDYEKLAMESEVIILDISNQYDICVENAKEARNYQLGGNIDL